MGRAAVAKYLQVVTQLLRLHAVALNAFNQHIVLVDTPSSGCYLQAAEQKVKAHSFAAVGICVKGSFFPGKGVDKHCLYSTLFFGPVAEFPLAFGVELKDPLSQSLGENLFCLIVAYSRGILHLGRGGKICMKSF